MPEPEFEAYLSLMSKLLRLTQRQRAEITAELRDHLEERLHELESQGHERSRAIELALEELGDATALAIDFAHPHLARRRRKLMRYTISSVAVITATFVLAAFYWPAQRLDPSVQVVAQAPVTATAPSSPHPAQVEAKTADRDDFRQQVEDKLSRRDISVSFVDIPLRDILSFLSDRLDLDFVLNRKHLEEQGIDADMTIALELRANSVTVRTLLELVLEQAGGGSLSYVIRDGVVLITSPEEGYEVQVYDCRDLLANVKVESPAPMHHGSSHGGFGGGFGGAASSDASQGASNPLAMLTGSAGGLGGGGAVSTSNSTSAAASALLNVITTATGDLWMDVDGVGGTITEFDGLIVVRHSQRAHRNIEDLFAKLREKKDVAARKSPVYHPVPAAGNPSAIVPSATEPGTSPTTPPKPAPTLSRPR